MIATLGDLVEDIVIRIDDPVNMASDTDAMITRRAGGSAANVARAAARSGQPARFIGQIGDDAIGRALVAETAADGVDVSLVRRAGRTGTIAVLVDANGERTMLTDRGACTDLDEPNPAWLDGVSVIHVPMYSLWGGTTSATAETVIGWAHDRDVSTSVDLSSVALLHRIGIAGVMAALDRLRPDVVLANSDEAEAIGIDGPIGPAVTVVKRGGLPTSCFRADGAEIVVPVDPIDRVADSTGAGDAFAAGFLTGPWRDELEAAILAGHATARAHLTSR